MKNRYTAVIKQDEGWWIGWVEEVPGVNCQAKTRAGLVRSLRVTLKEALDMTVLVSGLAAKQSELCRLQTEAEAELAQLTPALLAKAFRGEL